MESSLARCLLASIGMKKTDVQLLQEILDEIARDPRLAEAQVGVSVHDGVVTLAGTTSSWMNKLAAAEAAHRIAGVLDVANEVGVALPQSSHTDAALAAAIRHALQSDVTVPADRIMSTVADGFVALEGEVESFTQKDDAARAVRSLQGVVAVDNRIVVNMKAVTKTRGVQSVEDRMRFN